MRINHQVYKLTLIAVVQYLCLVVASVGQELPAAQAEVVKWVAQSGGTFRRALRPATRPVVHVDLNHRAVVDADLARLEVLVDLESICLVDTRLRGEGLQSLSKLPRLKFLHVGGSQFDAQHLKIVASFPALKQLALIGPSITSDSLAAIEKLPLTYLAIRDSAIDDKACASIATLSDLQLLNLWRSKITGAGLEQLAPLKKLLTLYVDDTAITDDYLKSFLQFPQLRKVGVRGTRLTPAGVAWLKNSSHRLHVLD